jgi:hypothetical protein
MGSLIRLKPDTVENAERELVKLLDQGAALAAEIEALAMREDELDDVGELITAQATTRAARNRLRKLDAKIKEAREHLAQAKATARAKLRAELLAQFGPEARAFLVKARALQEALERVVAAREALRSAGFATDYAILPVPPAINGTALPAPDLMAAFEAGLERLTQEPASLPSSGRRAPPLKPATVDPTRERSGLDRARTPVRPEVRAPIREIAAEGQVRVTVLRNGVELAGRQLRVGDVVAMAPTEAEIMIRGGAVDRVGDPANVIAASALELAK